MFQAKPMLKKPKAKQHLKDLGGTEKPSKKAKTQSFMGVVTPPTVGENAIRSESPDPNDWSPVADTNADVDPSYQRNSSAAKEAHRDASMNENEAMPKGEVKVEERKVKVEDFESMALDGEPQVDVQIRGVGIIVDVQVDGLEDIQVNVKVTGRQVRKVGVFNYR